MLPLRAPRRRRLIGALIALEVASWMQAAEGTDLANRDGVCPANRAAGSGGSTSHHLVIREETPSILYISVLLNFIRVVLLAILCMKYRGRERPEEIAQPLMAQQALQGFPVVAAAPRVEQRTVGCQSPVMYTAIRGSANPRFLPLPAHSHG